MALNRTMILALAAAFVSMAVVFVSKTFADTIFLVEFGAAYVPHFLVVQAAGIVAGSALYGALLKRVSSPPIDLAILGAFSLSAVGGIWADQLGDWAVFAVSLALSVLSALAFMAMWNAVTSVVSGRRSRRFLPLAGAAATAGAVVGSFGSTAVVGVFDMTGLAPVIAIMAVGAGALRVTLVSRASEWRLVARPSKPSKDRKPREPRTRALRERRAKTEKVKAVAPDGGPDLRLVRILAMATVIEAFLTAFVEFGFKSEVVASITRRDEIGLFFSMFYGISNAILLALQVLASSRLLATRSLRFSLALEPALLLLSAMAWAFFPTLALAAIARGTESVMKFGIARPAQEVALTPLTDVERKRWKVLLRGVYNQGGGAAAGLLLVAVAPWLGHHSILAPVATAITALVWLVLQLAASNRYIDTLGSALGLRRLSLRDDREVMVIDRDGLARVVHLAGASDETAARFGRELLTTYAHDPRLLIRYIGLGPPAQRETLYRLLAQRPHRSCAASLRAAMTSEREEGPAAACLDALAAHGDATQVARARALAGDAPPRVDPPEVEEAAAEAIAEAARAESEAERPAGAAAQDAPTRDLDAAPAAPAADGADGGIVAAAASPADALSTVAVPVGGEPAMVSPADGDGERASQIDLLIAPSPLPAAAWRYLAQVGALDEDPDQLRAVLAETLAHDGARAAELIRALITRGALTREQAEERVLAAASSENVERRKQGLHACGGVGGARPLGRVLEALAGEDAWLDEVVARMAPVPLAELLDLEAYRHSPLRVRSRVLRGLRSSEAPDVSDLVGRELVDHNPAVREMAARTLLRRARDHGEVVPRDLAERALELQLDRFEVYVNARPGYASAARESYIDVKYRAGLSTIANLTAEAFFIDELERRTERSLSRLCAVLALFGNPSSVYAAERALRAPTFKRRRQALDIMQEVARGHERARLLKLLERYLLPQREPPADARDKVCEMDPWLARCASFSTDPLMERLWALRSTLLFDDIDGELLDALAVRASEVDHEPERIVVAVGDPGDALYVVMKGVVTVEREGKVVAQLGRGQAFGELALVDGLPRQATVKSEKPSRLLRLPRDTFHEAMIEHPELGLGLVRGLVRWLRQGEGIQRPPEYRR